MLRDVTNESGAATAAGERQLIEFDVAGEAYGVDIESVREIIRLEPITRVPSMPDVVDGIINLRGVVTPIVDLRKLLQVNVTPTTDDSRVIVAETEHGPAGVLVDRVKGVVRLSESELQPLGASAMREGADYLDGVAPLDGRLLVVIDLTRALDLESLRGAKWSPPETVAPDPVAHDEGDDDESDEGAAIDEGDDAVADGEAATELPLQIELLEQSFEAVKPRGAELVEYFYVRLFEEHPGVLPLFEQTDMQEQAGKLLAALATVVANLRKPDVLVPHLQELGRRHVGYGAEPAHYDAVGAILLESLEFIAGDLWTDELRDAWAEAYGLAASVMIEAPAELEGAEATAAA